MASGRNRQYVYLEWSAELNEYRLVDSLGEDVVTSQFQGSGGISNGDKGEITVSGAGNVWVINPRTVTFAKFQEINSDTILGRATGGLGDVEELTPSAVVSMISSLLNEVIDDRVANLLVQGANISLNYNDVANTLTISASGGGSGLADGDYGDIIVGGGGASITIDLNTVDFTKIQQVNTGIVTGRQSAGPGNLEEISMAVLANMLQSSLAEIIDDRVANLLVAGSNITLNYNDTANTLTISSSGTGGSSNIDGGAADSDYTGTLIIDGGVANSSYGGTPAIDGGNA